MSGSCEFGKIFLYSTLTAYYLVGKAKTRSLSDRSEASWSILTLYRQSSRSNGARPILETHETPNLSEEDVRGTLRQLHAGNARGLQLVCKAYGIIGCVRFLESFYLLLITKREQQGSICGHKVYNVADTALIPLLRPIGPGNESSAEKRYRKLLLGLDMTHDFYFSYSYDIAKSLQHNMTPRQAPELLGRTGRFDSMFVWNAHLTRALRETLGTERWVLPLIHGFWQQRTLTVFGQPLTVTLVARRSRFFAGTRFQKRGINHEGQVANDVETEQIVRGGLDRRSGTPFLSSLVQVRGSFPLYWYQQGGTLGKPDILMQNFDPLFSATRAHFDDLRARYDSPVICLDLVKAVEKKPREVVLRTEFDTAIAYSNSQVSQKDQVLHVPWDLNFHAKANRGTALLQAMSPLCAAALDTSHFFVYRPGHQVDTQLQGGIVRTNCVDCLDRTNVAQFAIGLAGLGRQLQALALSDTPEIDSQCALARHLMDLYEAAGNRLARQYGGSGAHSTFFQRQRGDWEAATQSRDLVTSICRFYSNAYTDTDKQMGINLVLGNFIPVPGRPALWELDNDNYLHYTAGGGSRKSTSEPLPRSGSLPSEQQLACLLDRPAADGATAGTHVRRMDSPREMSYSRPLQRDTTLAASRFKFQRPATAFMNSPALHTSGHGLHATQLQQVMSEEAAALAALRLLARPPVVLSDFSIHSHIRLPHPAARLERPQHTIARPPLAPLPLTVAARPLPRTVSLDTAYQSLSSSQPCSAFAGAPLLQSRGNSCAIGSHQSAEAPELPSSTESTPRGDTLERCRSLPEGLPSGVGNRPRRMPFLPLNGTASTARRRHKLESLDRLIGQPPDVAHHVRLPAPASQKAYRNRKLIASMGRAKLPGSLGASSELSFCSDHLPPIAENRPGIRSPTPSILQSATGSTKQSFGGVRRTCSTDSGLQLLSALHPGSAELRSDAPKQHQSTLTRRQSLPTPRGQGVPGRALPGSAIYDLDALRDTSVDSLLFADRIGLLADSRSRKAAYHTSSKLSHVGPETESSYALTGKPRSSGVPMCGAPSVKQLLATDANGLGVSPYLLKSWVSDDDHLSMSAAAQASLRTQYQKFVTDAQAAALPSKAQPCAADPCQAPIIDVVGSS